MSSFVPVLLKLKIMKKVFTLVLLCTVGLINAQAFSGKGDVKGQVGFSAQDGGTGIFISSDFGIGENMSLGLTTNYLLSVDNDINGNNPSFGDRFDLKARFNANLGSVLQLEPNMDVYPGLDLGLKNFGAHLGFRYFFTDGFGLFAEAGVPLAKYDTNDTDFGHDLNNQFTFNVGASFNL
jgi:outer membrane protein G